MSSDNFSLLDNLDQFGNQYYPADDRAVVITKEIWDELLRSQLGDVTFIDDTDSPYTLTRERSVLLVDCTNGSVIVNLPPASELEQMSFTVTKTAGPATNTIAMTPDGTDTIKGQAGAMTMLFSNSSANVVADGVSDWRVM